MSAILFEALSVLRLEHRVFYTHRFLSEWTPHDNECEWNCLGNTSSLPSTQDRFRGRKAPGKLSYFAFLPHYFTEQNSEHIEVAELMINAHEVCFTSVESTLIERSEC